MAQHDGTPVSDDPRIVRTESRSESLAPKALSALILLCSLLSGCLGFGSTVSLEEQDRVKVLFVNPSGRTWIVARDPGRTAAEISEEAGENEKYGTTAEVQRLIDALEEAGFFDETEAIRTPPGGFLSVELVDAEGEFEVFTWMQPTSGESAVRKYALCRDQFFNEGFNKITTMLQSGDPKSFLREIERRTR